MRKGGLMTYWVIPANPTMYDVREAFRDLRIVYWKQGRNKSVKIGDIIFIYESVTSKSIILKTRVVDKDVYNNYIDDSKYTMGNATFNPPWMKLELIDELAQPITMNQLRENGVKGSYQSMRRLKEDIVFNLNLD